jgi:nicotinate-nucleotide pyrophosphorylase
LLGEIIATLEKKFSQQTFIDIEMNTLEDAYIAIAREEDQILYDLVSRGFRT